MDYLESQVDKILDKPNGQQIVWKSGDETFCPSNDYPIEIPKDKPIKKQLDEVKVSELIHHDGYIKRLKDLPEYFMEPYIDALRKAGDIYSVQGYFVSPLSLLIHVYGIQDTLIGLLDYPKICKKLLDGIAEGAMIWVDSLADSGLPVIAVTAPFEGMGFMSLDMFKEFGVPYVSKVIGHVKKRRAFTYMHMCGYINDRLEVIAETGVDGIECFDPPPIGNVELEDAVKRVGGKVFIKGNMDPVNTVFKKSPQEIYDDAVKRIKIGFPTERYILSTACAVSPDTPSENLEVIAKAAEDYGWY
jgi:uroporphyrinogen-III decarboxylase